MTNMITSLITAIHLAALSQIESGDNDKAIGKNGEVSRYQIMPAVAARAVQESIALSGRTFHAGWAADEPLARAVTFAIWEKRAENFRGQHHRPPNEIELYLLWHRPARVVNPKPRERDRAERFQNMVQELQKGGIK